MKIIIQFIIIHSTVRLSSSAFLPFHSIYYEIFFKAKTSTTLTWQILLRILRISETYLFAK